VNEIIRAVPEMMSGLMVHGGYVMPLLLAISTVMWIMIFFKGVGLLMDKRAEKGLDQCLLAVEKGELTGAFWQRSVLKNFALLKESGHLNQEALERLQHTQAVTIDRHIRTILILAGAAPLLGLLGTVNGMITTFDVISVFGTGNARAMAAGISEALFTTQAGLVVAVPGLLTGVILERRCENIKDRMQGLCLTLMRQALCREER